MLKSSNFQHLLLFTTNQKYLVGFHTHTNTRYFLRATPVSLLNYWLSQTLFENAFYILVLSVVNKTVLLTFG